MLKRIKKRIKLNVSNKIIVIVSILFALNLIALSIVVAFRNDNDLFFYRGTPHSYNMATIETFEDLLAMVKTNSYKDPHIGGVFLDESAYLIAKEIWNLHHHHEAR